MMKENRYPALRIVAGWFIVLAWIYGIATIIGFIACLAIGSNYDDEAGGYIIATGFVILIAGAFAVLMCVAISEGIKVFVTIEYNTRKTSEKMGAPVENNTDPKDDSPTADANKQKIKTLMELRDKGLITTELFEQKMKEILNEM